MEDVIVILNAADIPSALHIAKDLPAYSVYVFDPVLMDHVRASGMHNAELITWEDCPLFVELDSDAQAFAYATEAELDAAVRDIVPEVAIASWQHLNLYYLFMSLRWYTGLWEALGSKFTGKKAHICICDNPATYYFNSFLPSVLLLWYLKSRGMEFLGYTYGVTADVSSLVPNLTGLDEVGQVEKILTHLPTCFYDINYCYREIGETGKTVVNIDAKHFHVPFPGHKTLPLVDAGEMLPDLPDALRGTIEAFAQRIVAILDRCLAPYLVLSNYRARQVQHLATLYRCQLLTYYMLNRHFEQSKPGKVLLSDHDAGFHGPLVSFARRHFVPVLLVPHSKISTDIEFRYDNITALTHPIQGREIFDPSGKSVFNEYLLYPETFTSSNTVRDRLKTVSLLLNACSLNGMYFARWEAYIEGIRQIVAWSRKNEVELKIRCKPNYTLFFLLAKELGCSVAELHENMTEPMDRHVASCDLCLMYDSPTSAELYFLKNSVPIFNPVIRPLSPNELAICDPHIIPRDDVAATLRRIDGFLSDAVSFAAFRNAQFRNYIQLFQNARPLRSFL